MYYAPIPPLSLINNERVRNYKFHFGITTVALRDLTYAKAYAELAKEEGKHVILDNGAFENGSSDILPDLIDVAHVIQPQEIVLPDRMFMMDETLRMTREAMPKLRKYFPNAKLNGVAHGRNPEEWRECMWELLALGVDVISIPKDYSAWYGGRSLLLSLIPRDMDGSIHFFGWEPDIWHVWRMNNRHRVRSIDTVKPFVYAYRKVVHVPIPPTAVPRYGGRPENYFSLEENVFDENHVDRWLDIFDIAALGRRDGPSWQ